MSCQHRIVHSLPVLVLTAALIGLDPGHAQAGQGHGGGAGHLAAGGGGRFGGYGGYGGGFRGYGYGGYGFGYGFGLGLGLGFYGYPYYPYYGYGYPYPYPYPYAGVGYPGYAASAPPINGEYPAIPIAPMNATPAGGTKVTQAAQQGKSLDSDVTLIIKTPAEAVVWINGAKTTQTGPRREFVSSGLSPGRNYTFDIRAQWMGPDGKSVDLHRRIPVQAGDRRSIDFMLPPPVGSDVTVVQYGTPSK